MSLQNDPTYLNLDFKMNHTETLKTLYGLYVRFISTHISATVGIPVRFFYTGSEIRLICTGNQSESSVFDNNPILFSIKGMHLELTINQDYFNFTVSESNLTEYNPSHALVNLSRNEKIIKIELIKKKSMWEYGSKVPYGVLFHFSSGLRLIIHIAMPEGKLGFSLDSDYIENHIYHKYNRHQYCVHLLMEDGTIDPPWDSEISTPGVAV